MKIENKTPVQEKGRIWRLIGINYFTKKIDKLVDQISLITKGMEVLRDEAYGTELLPRINRLKEKNDFLLKELDLLRFACVRIETDLVEYEPKQGIFQDPEDFFSSFSEFNLLGKLAIIGDDDCLVCDEEMADFLNKRLRHRRKSSSITTIENLRRYLGENTSTQRLIVCTLSQEKHALDIVGKIVSETASINGTEKEIEVLGLLSNVLAQQRAVDSGASEANDINIFDPYLKFYSVICTPRTGSTLLCEALSSAGIGNPKEHLRPQILRLLEERSSDDFDVPSFAMSLIRMGIKNNIFGTKLIGNFMIAANKALIQSEKWFIRSLAMRSLVVYLYRSDRLLQTLSLLRARESGIWHSTDNSKNANAKSYELNYDYEEILNLAAYLENQEKSLISLISGHTKVIVLEYEKIEADLAKAVQQVADCLDVTPAGEITTSVEKLPGNMTDDLIIKFLQDYKLRNGRDFERYQTIKHERDPDYDNRWLLLRTLDRGNPVRPMDYDRTTLRENDEEPVLESSIDSSPGQPRGIGVSGNLPHAKSILGPYQDRHYYTIDYECFQLDGQDNYLRGPKPRSFETGSYFACVGAAQTYGALVKNPFPGIVANAIGIDALNLGIGGAGPRYFADNSVLIDYMRNARFNIIQVQSARGMGTSVFEDHTNRNMLKPLFLPDIGHVDSSRAWELLMENRGEEFVRSVVAEARSSWIAYTKKLIIETGRPCILLWFSSRTPDYEEGYSDVNALFGRFPQLVNADMIEEIKPLVTGYTECISSRGLPQKIVSEFTGKVMPVIFGGGRPEEQYWSDTNHYYPSPEMHEDAAKVLLPVVQDLSISF